MPPPPPPPASQPSTSGVTYTPDGTRTIPASRRPDGSIRPERKVRAGYVPPEDVTRYSNAKVQGSRVPEGYTPGLPFDDAAKKEVVPEGSKAARKNARRRLKKAAGGGGGGDDGGGDDDDDKDDNDEDEVTAVPEADRPAIKKEDPEKRVKALRKKLRQIVDIEAKRDKAPGTPLVQEQIDKIAAKPAIESEIAELEKALSTLSV
ncbi:hypothetical protein HKX48_003002 [Thoreauomyces humboldtii]|nr:hypothetical protein HKX48_003002 [Thoreauomyces humboldtii]